MEINYKNRRAVELTLPVRGDEVSPLKKNSKKFIFTIRQKNKTEANLKTHTKPSFTNTKTNYQNHPSPNLLPFDYTQENLLNCIIFLSCI